MAPSATTNTPQSSTSSSMETKTLTRGVYVPVLTFFNNDQTESLDLDSFSKHVEFVAKAGCAGVVVLGSTGERVALTEEERKTVSRKGKEREGNIVVGNLFVSL